MEIKDRIEEFIRAKGLTIKAFEQEIGISNGLWAKARTLSEDVLLKTINRFPELNSDWLLKGTKSNTSSESEELIRLREENARLREELRMKSDPEQPKKESEVYRLWMEHMKLSEQQNRISEQMRELYQKQKIDLK